MQVHSSTMTLPWLTENRNRSHAHEFKPGWKDSIAYLIQQAFIRQLRAHWCHHVHLNGNKIRTNKKNYNTSKQYHT